MLGHLSYSCDVSILFCVYILKILAEPTQTKSAPFELEIKRENRDLLIPPLGKELKINAFCINNVFLSLASIRKTRQAKLIYTCKQRR